ncbi:hypothetical protein AJ80_02982 [Polytolypa hystricis UAMH7299]|uniref:GPI-anchored cell wall organization protein Ecm33 n=1 Tax=Polytolypa hystricis (strain UAMH7299) TaxID=1447883 RepID=A0A2B7YPM0_POLH7|nr:hypothetical protein AJ80_02982 [Polytolypa hystricis UAMH7299]
MAFMKYLLPALALTSLATAQNSACKGKKTIENQDDANKLSSCKTIEGDVVIAKQTANVLTLDGIERISGSLESIGAENLTSLAAPQLATIGDSFKLTGLTRLTSLQFDSLTEVDSLDFEALPQLQQLNFGKGVAKAVNVRIANTDLTSLNGISLRTVGDMEVSNNRHLKEVDVNEITNSSGYISFSANHMDLKISFPNLENAKNITFRNVSEIAIPSLKKTEGLIGFYSNYFTSFIAANLSNTGDIVFADNSALTNISLPILEKVKGAFQIANNTALKRVDGIPKLKTITGTLDFSGNFSKVELPDLEEVGGAFNLQSSGVVPCDEFEKELKGEAVRGKFVCRSAVEDPKTENGGTSTSTGSKPTDSSFAVPLDPPAFLSMLALVGGAFGLVL